MPLYRAVRRVIKNVEPVGEPFMVQLGPSAEPARLMRPRGRVRGANVIFIDHPGFFDRPGLYGERGDYPDNYRRFAFLSLATVLALPQIAPGGARRFSTRTTGT